MTKLDFSDISVLVVGDVMLDKYFTGEVSRISPEAPVPVVNVLDTKMIPGGAGNVVNNIASLGASVCLTSVLGNDEFGNLLENIFDGLSVKYNFIKTNKPTTTKIRVIGNHQQIARLDFEQIDDIEERYENEIIDFVTNNIEKYNIIVLSDYSKGVCTECLSEKIIKIANKNCIPIIVDPKGNNWKKYSEATLITPNLKELGDALGFHVNNNDTEVEDAANKLLKEYNFENILVTRSDRGMSLCSNKLVQHIPTEAKEVYDVSGAGDTVVATLAVSLAKKISLEESVYLANKSAGIVVSKFGTTPIAINELNSSVNKDFDKIIDYSEISRKIDELKGQGKKIVFTNGCFDIIHRGHVTYLKKAKELGDILLLGLNTDASVKRIKGEKRPINNQNDRAEVLAALECIDYIVFFDDDTPYNLIKNIKPDVLLKGSDYKVEDIIGREFAKETILINFLDGYSTTKIINSINE